jgi:hypothetical protein
MEGDDLPVGLAVTVRVDDELRPPFRALKRARVLGIELFRIEPADPVGVAARPQRAVRVEL